MVSYSGKTGSVMAYSPTYSASAHATTTVDPEDVDPSINDTTYSTDNVVAWMDRIVGRIVARVDELDLRGHTFDPLYWRQRHRPRRDFRHCQLHSNKGIPHAWARTFR